MYAPQEGHSAPNKIRPELRNKRRKLLKETAEESDDSEEDGKKEELRNKSTNLGKRQHLRSSSESDSEEEKEETPAELKRPRIAPTTVIEQPHEDVASKLMRKMGYTEGKGLGARGQGRVEPVALSTQRGRLGLGHTTAADLQIDHNLKWDLDKETVQVEEYPKWIEKCEEDVPNLNELNSWMTIGRKKLEISDEIEFCSQEVLDKMLKAKNVFDELNDRDLRNARTRANPFETIKGAIFQNRAAMKTANMDAVFDWLLSNPRDPEKPDRPWVPIEATHPDLYYFADICAGPGGFTEYLLWKRGFTAHGFGFTLKGKDDFKLDKFLAAAPEMFEPCYGIANDGDIMNPENLIHFENHVKSITDSGIHLVMADGGFSVEGQENIQEILSKRLYLCQFLCALLILRPGGNFLCKLFDLFTPFSIGLVYLMYRAFDRICIHKPHTSRPANSERYIICKGLRSDSENIREYMRLINNKLDELNKSKPDQDVCHVVPLNIIRDDTEFCEYMIESNEGLAERQTLYLDKYRVFAKNVGLMDTKQEDLRTRCLSYWNVPNEGRKEAPRPNPSFKFSQLCKLESPDHFFPGGRIPNNGLTNDFLNRYKHDIAGLGYRVYASCDEAKLILACGKTNFCWNAGFKRWDAVNGRFSLPRDSLFFGEVSFRFKGQKQGQQKTTILRIIDAYMLAGCDVSTLPFDKRRISITKFCKAISREKTERSYGLVLPAEVFRLAEIGALKRRLSTCKIKGAKFIICHQTESEDTTHIPYIACRGLSLIRPVLEPWILSWSKSQRKAYIFNPKDGKTVYEDDAEKGENLVATFAQTIFSKLHWDWSPKLDFDVDSLLEENTETSVDNNLRFGTIPEICHVVEEQMSKNGVYSKP